MRVDVNNSMSVNLEEKYYIIEEQYKDTGKWYPLIDKFYLKEYEFGQNTSCGQCWQKTSQHGMYDFEYAKEYCNKLNTALKNSEIKLPNGMEISRFRIAAVEWTYKKEVLIPDMY